MGRASSVNAKRLLWNPQKPALRLSFPPPDLELLGSVQRSLANSRPQRWKSVASALWSLAKLHPTVKSMKTSAVVLHNTLRRSVGHVSLGNRRILVHSQSMTVTNPFSPDYSPDLAGKSSVMDLVHVYWALAEFQAKSSTNWPVWTPSEWESAAAAAEHASSAGPPRPWGLRTDTLEMLAEELKRRRQGLTPFSAKSVMVSLGRLASLSRDGDAAKLRRFVQNSEFVINPLLREVNGKPLLTREARRCARPVCSDCRWHPRAGSLRRTAVRSWLRTQLPKWTHERSSTTSSFRVCFPLARRRPSPRSSS